MSVIDTVRTWCLFINLCFPSTLRSSAYELIPIFSNAVIVIVTPILQASQYMNKFPFCISLCELYAR